MGSWLTYLWWSGDPDAVSPISGLTKREVYAVQKSWAVFYADYVANGTELLARLFTAYPHIKEYFKTLRHLRIEEYPTSVQVKAHVINQMTSINQAVVSLNSPEIVAVLMNKVGETHGRRKVKQEDFQDMKKVLVQMFIEVFKLDNATLEAWGKTVDFWYKHIFQTLYYSDTTNA